MGIPFVLFVITSLDPVGNDARVFLWEMGRKIWGKVGKNGCCRLEKLGMRRYGIRFQWRKECQFMIFVAQRKVV